MAKGKYEAIKVSRRIGAPASVIFSILADPGRHRALGGSGMLRGVVWSRGTGVRSWRDSYCELSGRVART